MVMKWDGVTPDIYERLRKTVNWEGDTPKGAVLHLAAFNKDGCQVNDIWESEADFNNFLQNRLMPGVQKVGVKGQPLVDIVPVHAIFAPAYEGATAH